MCHMPRYQARSGKGGGGMGMSPGMGGGMSPGMGGGMGGGMGMGGMGGVALMALGWPWWLAWVPVDAGGSLGSQLTPWTPGLFAWVAWHLATSTFTLRGRCGAWRQ